MRIKSRPMRSFEARTAFPRPSHRPLTLEPSKATKTPQIDARGRPRPRCQPSQILRARPDSRSGASAARRTRAQTICSRSRGVQILRQVGVVKVLQGIGPRHDQKTPSSGTSSTGHKKAPQPESGGFPDLEHLLCSAIDARPSTSPRSVRSWVAGAAPRDGSRRPTSC